jgi:hypothetical protein
MKHFYKALLVLVIATTNVAFGQQPVDRVKFFKDTAVINATISLNIKKLLAERNRKKAVFPATFSCKLGDSLNISDHINVEARGHFRRGYCYLPPFKLIFKNNPANAFHHLKTLKLVAACTVTKDDDQNLLKEFLTYKIYNLITDKSFRVRLLNLTYKDSSGKRKTFTEHAFLMEDISQLAKRNGCTDWTGKKFSAEATDRRQMLIAGIFEYMIGNTDWSVLGEHNTKLIHSKSDSLSRPYTVAYDFDFSGLVNTTYSSPDERLNIKNVQERLYRGVPATIDSLNNVFEIFKQQQQQIYATINNFNLLTPSTKKEMTEYLDGFYATINNPEEVKRTFINVQTQ